jgi:hypothetical protein
MIYCKYAECPYTPGRVTAIKKGRENHMIPPLNSGENPSKTRKRYLLEWGIQK